MTEKIPDKVVYVGSPELFSKGASAIHIMKMCQALARLGAETELLIPCGKRRDDLYSYYGVEPVFKITTFPYFSNTSLRNIIHGAAAALFVKFKRSAHEIVVTRNIIYAYAAAGILGMPTVYDAHHPLVKGASCLFDRFRNSDSLVRFSVNSAGLGKIYLDRGLPPEKLVVAHNGVDLERFENAMQREEAREELELPVEARIVCYSGNIYEGRGIEMLIDAALRLSGALFLVVGGMEKDVRKYRDMAREKGAENIKFTGFVPHGEVAGYLSASDVLVMPYTSGVTIRGGTNASQFTSPIKLFEYMAAGKPIVATALPTVLEILKDGQNALLVEPGNSALLSEALGKVLDDRELAKTLASASKADVKNYTWENRAKKLLGIKN